MSIRIAPVPPPQPRHIRKDTLKLTGVSTIETPKRDQLVDSVGRFRTQSLFRETSYQVKDHDPIYTLKEVDPQGKLPSLWKIYVELNDPTEYEFAKLCFGSWRHFRHLCTLRWFSDYINQYRDELQVKLQCEGIQRLKGHAQEKGGTPAAKYLAEAGWKGTKGKRGRPSTEEILGEKKRLALIDEEVGEDAQRMGLQVINGDKSD